MKLPGLRAAREASLLNQDELAARAGVSRGTIARLEAGYPARLPTIRKLATALEVEDGRLTEGSTPGSNRPPAERPGRQ